MHKKRALDKFILKLSKMTGKDKIFAGNNRGFTLIELLVGMGVFLMVTIIMSQTFTAIFRMQQTFLAKTSSMEQASYFMEHLSRWVRMAQKDTVGDCIDADTNFKFTDRGGIRFKTFQGQCVELYKDGDTLMESKNGVENPLNSPDNPVATFSIGPAFGWDPGDYLQPRVMFSVVFRDNAGLTTRLQATISQRNPDIIIEP